MTEILTETTAPLGPAAYAALFQNASEADYAYESSTRMSHVHVRRVGAEKGGLASRVIIAAHDHEKVVGGVYTASEARVIAARLLDLADEIDGKTPLLFGPASFDAIAEPDAEAAFKAAWLAADAEGREGSRVSDGLTAVRDLLKG